MKNEFPPGDLANELFRFLFDGSPEKILIAEIELDKVLERLQTFVEKCIDTEHAWMLLGEDEVGDEA